MRRLLTTLVVCWACAAQGAGVTLMTVSNALNDRITASTNGAPDWTSVVTNGQGGFFPDDQHLYSGDVLTIDWAAFELYDAGGEHAIEWSYQRELYDAAGVRAIDWNDRILIDAAGKEAADWNARELSDSTATESLDWESRALYDGTGKIVLDWSDRELYDSSGSVLRFKWDDAQSLTDSITNAAQPYFVLTTNETRSLSWTGAVVSVADPTGARNPVSLAYLTSYPGAQVTAQQLATVSNSILPAAQAADATLADRTSIIYHGTNISVSPRYETWIAELERQQFLRFDFGSPYYMAGGWVDTYTNNAGINMSASTNNLLTNDTVSFHWQNMAQTGGSTYTTNFNGRSTNAIYCASQNDLLRTAAIQMPVTITVNFWVKSNNGGQGAYPGLYDVGISDLVYFQSSVLYGYCHGKTWITTVPTGAILDNQWHMITMTSDGTNVVNIYTNGHHTGNSVAGAFGAPPNAGIWMGAWEAPYTDRRTIASFDDLAIWSRMLSGLEITNLYCGGGPTNGYPTLAPWDVGLTNAWHIDERQGTNIARWAGGRDATLEGGVTWVEGVVVRTNAAGSITTNSTIAYVNSNMVLITTNVLLTTIPTNLSASWLVMDYGLTNAVTNTDLLAYGSVNKGTNWFAMPFDYSMPFANVSSQRYVHAWARVGTNYGGSNVVVRLDLTNANQRSIRAKIRSNQVFYSE